VGCHIQADGAVENHASQLKQGMQAQGSHVRFGPSIATFFHIFFELDPPDGFVIQLLQLLAKNLLDFQA